MLMEIVIVVAVMLLAFVVVFFLIFLLASAMLPVEKSLSKVIWEMTAPKRKPTPKEEGGFKAFSQNQQQSQKRKTLR
jgi:hypothetical protein